MLYDQLREIAMHADWRQLTVEYAALAIGAFMVAAGLIASRMRIRKRMQAIETKLGAIETKLSRMQNEIAALLQVQAALITRLNGKSKVETDPRYTTVEMADSEVIGLTVSPPTTPAQSEGAKPAKLAE